jgi:hypothetical protein
LISLLIMFMVRWVRKANHFPWFNTLWHSNSAGAWSLSGYLIIYISSGTWRWYEKLLISKGWGVCITRNGASSEYMCLDCTLTTLQSQRIAYRLHDCSYLHVSPSRCDLEQAWEWLHGSNLAKLKPQDFLFIVLVGQLIL